MPMPPPPDHTHPGGSTAGNGTALRLADDRAGVS